LREFARQTQLHRDRKLGEFDEENRRLAKENDDQAARIISGAAKPRRSSGTEPKSGHLQMTWMTEGRSL
jgi:hypothetical protein